VGVVPKLDNSDGGPAIEVLQTITQSMLADGELDDDEVLYFLNLWDVTEEVERTNWTQYASQILLQAADDHDEATVANLENLLFEVDYDTSNLVASRDIDPNTADENESEIIDPASAHQPVAPESMDRLTAVVDVASVTGYNNPSEQGGSVGTTDELLATELVTGNEADLVQIQNHDSVEIASSSPTSFERADPSEKGVLADGTMDSRGTESDDLIQVPVPIGPIDIESAFVQLRSSFSLTESELASFIDAWKSASPAEKLNLARLNPVTEFAGTQKRVVEELNPYTYASVEDDARKTRLLRVKRILRQLVKKGLEQQNDSSVDWLRNADDSYYTLQLVGSHSKNNILEYMAKQRVPEGYAYFETKRDDKSWFVVVGGQYPDRSTALAAIERLPVSNTDEIKPWARSVQSVRKDIRQQQSMGQQ